MQDNPNIEKKYCDKQTWKEDLYGWYKRHYRSKRRVINKLNLAKELSGGNQVA